jgi:hypothetical protein
MIDRVKCYLGFHNWEHWTSKIDADYEKCIVCGKRRPVYPLTSSWPWNQNSESFKINEMMSTLLTNLHIEQNPDIRIPEVINCVVKSKDEIYIQGRLVNSNLDSAKALFDFYKKHFKSAS